MTPQNLILPRLLLCVQKVAERSFLGCFLTFLWTSSAPKLLKLTRVHVLITLNPKMQPISSMGAPTKSTVLRQVFCVMKFKIANDKICLKLAKNWCEAPPSCDLMSQGGFIQHSNSILLFLAFQSPLEPSFHFLDPHLIVSVGLL